MTWAYTDPKFVTSDNTVISCMVTHPAHGNIPFTASATDVEPDGASLFAEIIANQATVPIAPYIAPSVVPPTPEQQAASLLNTGLTITSTSGDWTATFAVLKDPTGNSIWTLLLSEQDALTTSGNTVFADGETTVNWPDTTGTLHVLTPTQFAAFKMAIGRFVAQARNFSNKVSGATLPVASVVIP